MGGTFQEKHLRYQECWGYLFSVASLVYLTSHLNSKLADDLRLAGHRVFEARDVSEALYLCERQRVDAIVIAPDIDDPDLAEAQLHHITIRMKGSVHDLIWELSRLFPDKATIQ
jgi:hypothetical protein